MGKIDKRKKYYLLVDTETNWGEGLAYEIGWGIVDRKGNLQTLKGYSIKGMEITKKGGSKAPPETYQEIIRQLKQDFQHYRVEKVMAYNMEFDNRILQNTAEYFNQENPIDELEKICLWDWVVRRFCSSKSYKTLATEQGKLTEKGNIQTSLEAVYQIMSGKNYQQRHTAVADVRLSAKVWGYSNRCKKTKKTKWEVIRGD
jgi:hypothetical protein